MAANSIQFKIKGLEQQKAALAKVALSVSDNVLRTINAGAAMIHRTAVKSIQQGSKSGAIYGKKNHQASAPGEAPATDHGILAANILIDFASETDRVALIISNAAYSKALEFGTRKMAARPFMKPAYDENIETIRKRVRSATRAALNKK